MSMVNQIFTSSAIHLGCCRGGLEGPGIVLVEVEGLLNQLTQGFGIFLLFRDAAEALKGWDVVRVEG